MIRSFLTLACLLALTNASAAENREWRQAQFDYMMHCQGCHTPDGSGADSVPRMKDHVGYFLQSEQGREYLVRVPGSATSALTDARLATVLNWILVEFAGRSLDQGFQPYSASEVGQLRQKPLNEVDQYRADLLRTLSLDTRRYQ